MKIYISSGETEEDSVFKDDPKLKEDCLTDIENLAAYLITKYGEPDIIKCSPYKSAKQTALIMNDMLGKPLEFIDVDTRLADYKMDYVLDIAFSLFSKDKEKHKGKRQLNEINKEFRNLEIRPETFNGETYLGSELGSELDFFTSIYNIPKKESFDSLGKRVENQYKKEKKQSGIIWYITHNCFINKLTEGNTDLNLLNIKNIKDLGKTMDMPDFINFEPLDYIII